MSPVSCCIICSPCRRFLIPILSIWMRLAGHEVLPRCLSLLAQAVGVNNVVLGFNADPTPPSRFIWHNVHNGVRHLSTNASIPKRCRKEIPTCCLPQSGIGNSAPLARHCVNLRYSFQFLLSRALAPTGLKRSSRYFSQLPFATKETSLLSACDLFGVCARNSNILPADYTPVLRKHRVSSIGPAEDPGR